MGTLLTTSECLLSPNRNGQMNKVEIEEYLKMCISSSAGTLAWIMVIWQEMIQIAISIHLSVYVPLIRSYMYNVKMRKMSIINLFMPWKSSLKHFVRWPESLIAY